MVAQGYARIFYRNSINGGYLVPLETRERLIDEIATGDEVEVDLKAGKITNLTKKKTYKATAFPAFMQQIIDAGGLMEYVKKKI